MRLSSLAAFLCGSVLLALPAAAAPSRQERNAAIIAAAKPDGPPKSCVQLNLIRETRVRSDNVIDFYMRDSRVYRVTLPQQCPELGFEESFTYETSLNELCSTDIITVLRHIGGVSRGASCGLAEFQPITGVPR